MNKQRPVHLDLAKIRFPVTAIVSILHRVSGVAIFFLFFVLLYMLDLSFEPDGFASLKSAMAHDIVRAVFILMLGPFLFHLCAGIKHLLMDLGFAETKESGRLASIITFVCFILFWVWTGAAIW